MANRMTCRIVTPEAEAWKGDVRQVVLPGSDGEVAFLSDHAPYVGRLGFGEARITDLDNKVTHFAVLGGFVTVGGNEVLVAAEGAVIASEIDLDEARRDAQTAEEELRKIPVRDEFERDAGEIKLASARARVLAGERSSKRNT